MLAISKNPGGILSALSRHTETVGTVSERLSSGARINRASDDAAGLSIATQTQLRSRILSQGVRNINDGISLLNIADAAITELQGITDRLKELSTQAASTIYGGAQRISLDREAQQLSKEYARILQSTDFNGRKLFERAAPGDDGLTLQAGNSLLSIDLAAVSQRIVGTGHISSVTSIGTGSSRLGTLAVHLDNDGIDDLISVATGAVQTYLGNGDGTFRLAGHYLTTGTTEWVVTQDFNNDSYLDVAAVSYGSNDVRLYKGGGDGTLTFTGTAALPAFGQSGDAGDINGDGNIDLIIGLQSNNSYGIMLGNGDGTFKATRVETTGSSLVSQTHELADLNGDGKLDLILGQLFEWTVRVALGNGDGTFAANTSYLSAAPQDTDIGDLDGDGDLDFVVAEAGANRLNIFTNDGTGRFIAQVIAAPSREFTAVQAVDFNGDSIVDLVASSRNDGSLSVFLGNGNGTFKAEQNSVISTGYPVRQFAVGDFNRDGAADVIAPSTSGSAPIRFARGTPVVQSFTIVVSPLAEFSLLTVDAAHKTQNSIESVQQDLGLIRGVVGAHQSRAYAAADVLRNEALRTEEAASRILDADVATEVANLTGARIRQQVATALATQIQNVHRGIVLSLLQ